MIRRPPRSTLSSSSAASDVYKRQVLYSPIHPHELLESQGSTTLTMTKSSSVAMHGGLEQISKLILKPLKHPSVDITTLGIPLQPQTCLLYTSPSPRDRTRSRMPSSA
eukprot:TRINITY_DN19461_c0_g1_i1.p1 TRINITY_DN19461_c0_g1~~TRINITY_DN19461_c0_g1_i1.p1  ORF type:complete len:108 (-),score=20.92 TRINITY_DN19461_c0_g1_i1:36-359(-)